MLPVDWRSNRKRVSTTGKPLIRLMRLNLASTSIHWPPIWAANKLHKVRTWWLRRTLRPPICIKLRSLKMPLKWHNSNQVLITSLDSLPKRPQINNSSNFWIRFKWIWCCSSKAWTLLICSNWCRTQLPSSKWCTKCSNNPVIMVKLRLQLLPCRSRGACLVRLQACHKQQTMALQLRQMPLKRREWLIGQLKTMAVQASPAPPTVIAPDHLNFSLSNKFKNQNGSTMLLNS